MNNIITNPELSRLLKLDDFIHQNNKNKEYHKKHIRLVGEYALLLNRRLNTRIESDKLLYIAYAHDLFKESGLDKSIESREWNGFNIPQDNVRTVRMNIDILDKFDVGDYFNSSIQYHGLASAIFLYKNFELRNPEIIYPIMFHSCPIMNVYNGLNLKIRNMIDIIMLSDKLSSNYLRINLLEKDVQIDLDAVVFGTSGNECNFTLGLYLARLIATGSSSEEEGLKTNEFYHQRLMDNNPLIKIKDLGGKKKWPKRKSQALMRH